MSKRAPYEFDAPKDGAPIFWKSLEEKANPEQARARAVAELEQPVNERDLALGRRGFLTLSAITTALFAEGCARRPVEKVLPYARTPEQTIPGVPAHFATVFEHRGEALGLVVESTDGRPTKVEGNPDHPESLGATDAFAQAEIFNVYDPDRLRSPLRGGRGAAHVAATSAELEAGLADVVRGAQADQGARLRFLVQPTSSPTFARIVAGVKTRFPKAKVHVWEPISDANVLAGAKLAFGAPVRPRYDFAQAKTILSLDSDFLDTESGSVRHARGFAAGRKVKSPTAPMNRLYAVEPTFTVTGMSADHRLRLAGSQVPAYALALAKELATKHGLAIGGLGQLGAELPNVPKPWIEAVAKDLASSKGASLVVAGPRQPAFVHALAHALNQALGNVGRTVSFHGTPEVRTETISVNFAGAAAAAELPDAFADVKALADDIQKGLVGTLVVLGGNPAYDAPADLGLAEKIKSVGTVVHLAHAASETTAVATWLVPRAHALESWGDATSSDGTVSIRQPLVAPLFGGLSDVELLARFTSEPSTKGLDLVKGTFKAFFPTGVGFQKAWNEGLQKGVVAHRESVKIDGLAPRGGEIEAAAKAWKAPAAPTAQALEVAFAADPKLHDGRHANNAWLQELPDPVSKLTWDNAAYLSPGTAKELGVVTGDVLRLGEGKAVDAAVFVLPGQADGVVTLNLGWGRQVAGRFGDKHGFDAYPLRTTTSPWFVSGVKAQKLDAAAKAAIEDRFRKPGLARGDSPAAGRIEPNGVYDVETGVYKLVATQEHGQMEGRPVAVDATLAEYRKVAVFPQYPNEDRKDRDLKGNVIPVRKMGTPDPKVLPLWNKRDYSKGHKWGMAFDLSGCTGCNACVVACQAENNVAVVGKEQVSRGREMSWLRIDRYYVGLDENDPQISFQPVACVQCEEAPCENVCPVNATEHSPEGLNDMAYNRCIGTRYCANNCPYKVRRFNWLNYHAQDAEKDLYEDVADTEKMRMNPNVTVRFRGVMEKCTYCVQRIQEAKIVEKRTGTPMKDGDVVVACQQACPAGCIAFGDLNDPKSKVSEWRARDRAYRLLADLGTGPRTSYLGKIRNPNPDMGAKA